MVHGQPPVVERDNFLTTIEIMLSAEAQIVIVEGRPGSGKSTLMAQFAQRNCYRSISLFVRLDNRYSYDADYVLLELCNQMKYALDGNEVNLNTICNAPLFKSLIFELQRVSRSQNNTPFYFLIDGITDIPQENVGGLKAILDLLPIGLMEFRFVLSGNMDVIQKQLPRTTKYKNLTLTGFTLDESRHFFGQLAIKDNFIKEFHRIYSGSPMLLAVIRRLILNGEDAENILAAKSPDLFEMEWQTVDTKDSNQLSILSIIAFDHRPRGVREIAGIVGSSEEEVRKYIEGIQFLAVNPDNTQVMFLSDHFRAFVAKKLESHKQDSLGRIIDFINRSDDDNNILEVPGYLERAGRQDDLLAFLSPANFEKIVHKSQSLRTVFDKAETGAKTAFMLRKDSELLKFALKKSVMLAFEGSDAWRSEIDALVALGRYEDAYSLAHSATLKEDRVHMFAVIAKGKSEKGSHLEPELLELIKKLIEDIDWATEGERGIDIAADLLYTLPDLALEIVEKSADSSDSENSLDWAFSKLSLNAIVRANKATNFDTAVSKINERVGGSKLEDFVATAAVMSGGYSAVGIIERIKKLTKPNNKLFLLRQWTRENAQNQEAGSVIRCALELLISTTDYSPNAQVYRELATPIPYLKDRKLASELVSMIDAQRVNIMAQGPSEEYVQLQLILAKYEATESYDLACERIMDVFYMSNDISDLVSRGNCMAHLLNGMIGMDPSRILENRQMHSEVERQLDCIVDELIGSLAEHNEIARGILRILAVSRMDWVLNTAMRFNTQARRDEALRVIAKSMFMESDAFSCDLEYVDRVLANVASQRHKDDILVMLFRQFKFSSIEENLSDVLLKGCSSLLPLVRNSRKRCRAYGYFYGFLAKLSSSYAHSTKRQIFRELVSAWEQIEVDWERVELGFWMAETLATTSSEDAIFFLDSAEKLRKNLTFNVSAQASPYSACVSLCIRVYVALLSVKKAREDDLSKLYQCIDIIPPSYEKAALLSEFTLRCYRIEEMDICNAIVKERIKPMLDSIADERFKEKLIVSCAAALCASHLESGKDFLRRLPDVDREEALEDVCLFFFHQLPTGEPFEGKEDSDFQLSYDMVLNICSVLEVVDSDATIYWVINKLAHCMRPDSKIRFSIEQRTEIIRRLAGIVEAKLPSARGIKHDGYRIVAEAQLRRMRSDWKKTKYDDLVRDGHGIPNISDRSLVLAILASCMPKAMQKARCEAFDEAVDAAKQIPSSVEKAQHFLWLASYAPHIDKMYEKVLLQNAMPLVKSVDTQTAKAVRLSIIDQAYQIDPHLANALVAQLDDDPARKGAAARLRARVHVLELKKKILDGSTASVDVDKLSDACWLLLGSLNADRIETVSLDNVRTTLARAGERPLSESYPILAWTCENVIRRYAQSEEKLHHLRRMFDALLVGTELVSAITDKLSSDLRRNRMSVTDESSLIVRRGQQSSVLQFIRQWLQNNTGSVVKIMDPYFGPNELQIVKWIMGISRDCSVQVITGQRHNSSFEPLASTYREKWRQMSDEEPPPTEIVVVGNRENKEAPFHDRYIISNGKGLRLGTSLNSIGVTKDSEVSELDSPLEKEALMDRYFLKQEKMAGLTRLDYQTFTL